MAHENPARPVGLDDRHRRRRHEETRVRQGDGSPHGGRAGGGRPRRDRRSEACAPASPGQDGRGGERPGAGRRDRHAAPAVAGSRPGRARRAGAGPGHHLFRHGPVVQQRPVGDQLRPGPRPPPRRGVPRDQDRRSLPRRHPPQHREEPQAAPDRPRGPAPDPRRVGPGRPRRLGKAGRRRTRRCGSCGTRRSSASSA